MKNTPKYFTIRKEVQNAVDPDKALAEKFNKLKAHFDNDYDNDNTANKQLIKELKIIPGRSLQFSVYKPSPDEGDYWIEVTGMLDQINIRPV